MEQVKIIHYCWFGGKPLSKMAKKCMKTWKKVLPDYEIKRWDETNFDVKQNRFIKKAYEEKKWAFVADFARICALKEYGGLYLDTDVKILKKFDGLSEYDVFLGRENLEVVNGAIIGVNNKENKFISDLYKFYNNLDFEETNLYSITIPTTITKLLKEKYELKTNTDDEQILNGKIIICPREYFYPLNYLYTENLKSKKTIAIHLYDASWVCKSEKVKIFFIRHKMGFVMPIINKLENLYRRIRGKIKHEI